MWVYQEPVSSKTLAVPQAAPAPADAARPDPAPFVPFCQRKSRGFFCFCPAGACPQGRFAPGPGGRRQDLARECAILAASYLFGALLSGVALALGSGDEQAFLSAYLDNWSRLFTLDEPGAVWTLFGAEYLTAAGSATLLLLLGAVGLRPRDDPPLCNAVRAWGSGVVSLQLFFDVGLASCPAGAGPVRGAHCGGGWPGFACLGRSAPSGQRPAAAGRVLAGRSSRPWPGPGGLLAQYLVLNVLFLPVCGVSTALACLAGQLL